MVFRKVKYAFDAIAALLGSILLLPVFAGFALVIKLTSEGRCSSAYRGRQGRSFFKMYKFRSMVTGASNAPISNTSRR
jgi:lipopolysaccharide/colanic/teichoic acid biosynthesis glycosyltransferase